MPDVRHSAAVAPGCGPADAVAPSPCPSSTRGLSSASVVVVVCRAATIRPLACRLIFLSHVFASSFLRLSLRLRLQAASRLLPVRLVRLRRSVQAGQGLC